MTEVLHFLLVPDKVATAVFRLLGMPSPRRVTEVDAPPQSEEAAQA